jgi:uncharacterized membrane protein
MTDWVRFSLSLALVLLCFVLAVLYAIQKSWLSAGIWLVAGLVNAFMIVMANND